MEVVEQEEAGLQEVVVGEMEVAGEVRERVEGEVGVGCWQVEGARVSWLQ
jgi:hypothetical protein